MKFLLDENVERRLIAFFLASGHNTKKIGDDYPHGLLDADVLSLAVQEQRILVTHDHSDFGKLIFHDRKLHCGVILFRHIRSGDIALKKELLSLVLRDYAEQLDQFIVVTPRRIKVRKSTKKQAA